MAILKEVKEWVALIYVIGLFIFSVPLVILLAILKILLKRKKKDDDE